MEKSDAAFCSPQSTNFNDECLDFDDILQEDFDFDFDFDFDLDFDSWVSNSQSDGSTPPTKESESLKSEESPSAYIVEIEKLLMNDNDSEEALIKDCDTEVNRFMSELIVDGSGSGSGSESAKSEVPSPQSVAEAPAEVVEELEDGEQMKKRRRQMKNRESAMQSRERRKMYVKELEMKSNYLEAECRRLDSALRFYMSENLALHQRLLTDGARAEKQESAVLLESLLLGSLFWLASIIFLFLNQGLLIPNLKGTGRLERDLAVMGRSKAVSSKTSVTTGICFESLIIRRRCRGLKTRMKSFSFPVPV